MQPTKVEYDLDVEVVGLKDDGHTYLLCSNCDAYLVDIFHTNRAVDIDYKVQASCPFCGDTSFQIDVHGGVHWGGFGKIKADDIDTDIPSTIINNIDVREDVVFLDVQKATKDAKPVYKRG